MRAIWKFPLEVADLQKVSMPKGAVPVCVQVQHDVPCIWAIVDSDAQETERHVAIIETEHKIDLLGPAMNAKSGIKNNYIGTFQLYDGGLVFHVFISRE